MRKMIPFICIAVAAAWGIESAQACIPAIYQSTVYRILSPGRRAIEHTVRNHESLTIELVVPADKKSMKVLVEVDNAALSQTKKTLDNGQTLYTFLPKASGNSTILVTVTGPGGKVLEKLEQKVSLELMPQSRSSGKPTPPAGAVFPGGC